MGKAVSLCLLAFAIGIWPCRAQTPDTSVGMSPVGVAPSGPRMRRGPAGRYPLRRQFQQPGPGRNFRPVGAPLPGMIPMSPGASAAGAGAAAVIAPNSAATAAPATGDASKESASRTDDHKADDHKTDGDDSCRRKGKARADAPCLSWINPRVPPRAVILCVHGLGLHSASWEQFGKRMSALGYPTYAIDVRGFGSWMQAKGREKVNFKGCLEDVEATLKAVRAANPGLPVVLMGESMGGAVALQATALYPQLIDALVSSVPAGERFQQKKTELKVALHLLAGFNRPFNIGDQIIDQATDKPALQDELKGDPLGRMKLSPTELMQFQDFMNENHDRAREIKSTPVLIVQGADDKLVKPEGTVELFQELATPDKDLEMVPNAEHLIFEEGQFKDDTIKVVVDWLNRHLPPPAPGAATPFIAQARASFAQGQMKQAFQSLQAAVKAQPDSAEAQFLLGAASLKQGQLPQARDHLRQAIKFGRGTMFARRANQLLMTMPPDMFAPKMRPGGPARGPGRKRLPMRNQSQPGTPSVLIFGAKWSEPCKEMESVVAEARQRFGSQVRFIDVDVDDPNNEKLIEQYSISPVPTVVFLRGNGEVADYAIGYSGIDGWVRGMKKILGGAS